MTAPRITSRTGPRSRRAVAGGLLGSALLVSALTGCSADSSEGGGDVTLNFWTWSLKGGDERAEAIIDTYEQANPGVTIKLSEVGGTADTSSKLLAADRANEVPDVVQVEYRALPSLVVAGVVKDITEGVEPVKDAFADNIWDLTTLNGEVYGLPQDIGPMMLTYRADRFAELGVAVPTTWEEYATAAEQIRAADPTAYIASFAPTEFAFFASQAAQAGASWWESDGEEWTVGVDDDESIAVANYWQDLVDRDLVKVEPLLTPEWNAQVNDGKILSWAAASWAPSVIYAVAPDTAGAWQGAPLPQWSAGDPAVPFLGGSTYLIPEKSKHAEEATKFASWLAGSDEGAKLLLGLDLYPGATAGREATKSAAPPLLMPEQTDFYELTDQIISDSTIPLTWGPNVNVAQTALGDALQQAALDGTPFADAFATAQQAIIDDLEKSGYTVAK